MITAIIILLCYGLAIMFTGWLIPGIEVDNILSASILAIVLGLINLTIKPILILITLPVNILTLGLLTLVINALLLMFAGAIVPGIEIGGFWNALFGSILLSILFTGIGRYTNYY